MYEDVEIEDGGATKLQSAMGRKWQHILDVSAPHTGGRWALSSVVILIYCIRVYLLNGASDVMCAFFTFMPYCVEALSKIRQCEGEAMQSIYEHHANGSCIELCAVFEHFSSRLEACSLFSKSSVVLHDLRDAM